MLSNLSFSLLSACFSGFLLILSDIGWLHLRKLVQFFHLHDFFKDKFVEGCGTEQEMALKEAVPKEAKTHIVTNLTTDKSTEALEKQIEMR